MFFFFFYLFQDMVVLDFSGELADLMCRHKCMKSFSCETFSDASGNIEHEVQQVALPCHSSGVLGYSLC